MKLINHGDLYERLTINFKNMGFIDYMNSLPNEQLEMIKRLEEATCSSNLAVRRWMSGETVPPPLKQAIIAKELGKTIEELFPPKIKE